MPQQHVPERDLKSLVVPDVGRLLETGDPWEPYRLLDPADQRVEPVAVYLKDLLANYTPTTTLRSFGYDLLRWWRFLWVLELEWDKATQSDARDFMLWMQLADKPVRAHWRRRGEQAAKPVPAQRGKPGRSRSGTPNVVTGKPGVGTKFSLRTQAHSESVLRTFYNFHLDDRGDNALLLNPFPLDRRRGRNRANAHHNPMEKFKPEHTGRYRPKIPKRIPRRIPDEKYTEVFAGLNSHRDRALLAFWVATGARANELLSPRQSDARVGDQTIGVIRKGSGDLQELPATPDAFVWLRLYQEEAWRKGVPRGRNQPLWWTLRRPWRPLQYHAARAMFTRAQKVLGSNWTLHDLRHTATFLMLDDPEMPPVYVQHILGHKCLSTLRIYNNPSRDEVISAGLAHHVRQERKRANPQPAPPAPDYNPDSLNNLFGGVL
ncbi:tyrosine-type recombinase/integrase [Streptomyces sp. NPDC086010]|uniref:tyrosine-type recombinase/integrase n=1 Tax=Streptomyces sp. NPDC086010 TaxID=3365745 RepID=UPI0037D821CE